MKILQVNYKMDIGGIESFLMNVYRNIDRSKYQFVFLTYFDKTFDFEEEIESLGGKVVRISNPNDISIIKHVKEIYHVIRKEKIEAVHCHTYFNAAYVVLAAFLAKVKIRVVHSHTTLALTKSSFSKKVKWGVSRMMIRLFSTHRLACSQEAGKALYKNMDFKVISNGIDFSKFFYSEEKRKEGRSSLNIPESTFVLGHVGRLDTPKNHIFLIDILEEIVKKQKDALLLLVGTGPLEKELKDIVKKKGLEKKVLFLGNRKDVGKYLCIFDLFVFPSLYEGLPVSLVEVQANGLPALISDVISKEIQLTACIHYFSLEKSASIWADEILKMNVKRVDTIDALQQSDYSIHKTVSVLTQIFENIESVKYSK